MRTPRGGGVFLLSLLCLVAQGNSATSDCPDAPDSQSFRLRKTLFCSYDRNVRPSGIHTNVTNVSVDMWVRFYYFQSAYDTLVVSTWTVWRWKDQHLIWDKSEYGELKKLHVSSTDIWVPDISQQTFSDMTLHSATMPETLCHLSSDGSVVCVSPTEYSAPCYADIASWPFDQHECNFRVASLSTNSRQINFTLNDDGITDISDRSRDWKLLDSAASLVNFSFADEIIPGVNFKFVLKRIPGGAAASVLVPAGVLATLTLIAFCLDPKATERLCLICLNILCHCLYLQHLGRQLPNNGDKQPVIILFFRDSLLLVGASLVISILVRKMLDASSPPPAWAAALASGAQDSLPGQILLCGNSQDVDVATPSDADQDGDKFMDKNKAAFARTWQVLGTLLDRVAFLSFFVTIFALLCAYIP